MVPRVSTVAECGVGVMTAWHRTTNSQEVQSPPSDTKQRIQVGGVRGTESPRSSCYRRIFTCSLKEGKETIDIQQGFCCFLHRQLELRTGYVQSTTSQRTLDIQSASRTRLVYDLLGPECCIVSFLSVKSPRSLRNGVEVSEL